MSKQRTSAEILKDLNRTEGAGDQTYVVPIPEAEAAALRQELDAAKAREAEEIKALEAGYTIADDVAPQYVEPDTLRKGDNIATGEDGYAVATPVTRRDSLRDPLPAIPKEDAPILSLQGGADNIYEATDDDEIYENVDDMQETILAQAKIDPRTVTKAQGDAAAKAAKTIQALEDPKKAAEGYKVVAAMLEAKGDYRDQQKVMSDAQEGKPVDFGLSSFFSFIGAMLDLDDKKEREAGLAKVMKEFDFLKDENLSQEDRITNVIKAEKNICGKSPTAAREAGTLEDAQSSQPQEAQALSEASKKKVQEKVTKDREKFLKKAEEDPVITKKAIAITAGKAAVAMALSFTIPGGPLIAIAFLYFARDLGAPNLDKQKKMEEELAQAKRDLGSVGDRGKRSYQRKMPDGAPSVSADPLGHDEEEHEEGSPKKGANRLATASAQVADRVGVELEDERGKLHSEQQALIGVGKKGAAPIVVAPPSLDDALSVEASDYADLGPHRIDDSLVVKGSDVAPHVDDQPEYELAQQLDDEEELGVEEEGEATYDVPGRENPITPSELARQQQSQLEDDGIVEDMEEEEIVAPDQQSEHDEEAEKRVISAALGKEAVEQFKKMKGGDGISHDQEVQVAPNLKAPSTEIEH